MGLWTLKLVLAAGPVLLLLLYFYRRDKIKKEPPKLIWKTFAFGLIGVVPALIIELVLMRIIGESASLLFIAIDAFIVVALVEELIKYGVVKIYIFKKDEFDEVTDGIVYTIAASLGFALLENLMYSFGSILILLIRGVTAVPLHATASGIMGYYIGLSKMYPEKSAFPGILFAILIHGLYDFLLFTETAAAFGVVPLLIFACFMLRLCFKKAARLDREFQDAQAVTPLEPETP
jgi:RsiW-degrading membrane proteinase PrsW (M82 family)